MDIVAKPPREVRRQQQRFGTSNVIQTASGSSVKNKFQAVDMIAVGRERQQAEKQGTSILFYSSRILSKTHLSKLSTGSTQEDPFLYN